MKKYFCVGDIHSFYQPFMKALNEKGFDKNNQDHILVVCGDLFDRGPNSIEVLSFVQSLPEDRFVYVRGNHEDLMFDCYQEIYDTELISHHHVSNGTVNSIIQLCGLDEYYASNIVWDPYHPFRGEIIDKLPEVLNYIKRKSVDYFEIGNYIMVHGWIPCEKILLGSDKHYRNEYTYNYIKDWRNSSSKQWFDSRWINGMDAWRKGVREEGKTIICGHWHCSWGWENIKHERPEFPSKEDKDFQNSFETFVDEGIIAIDGCTAYSGVVNCFVFEVEDN